MVSIVNVIMVLDLQAQIGERAGLIRVPYLKATSQILRSTDTQFKIRIQTDKFAYATLSIA